MQHQAKIMSLALLEVDPFNFLQTYILVVISHL